MSGLPKNWAVTTLGEITEARVSQTGPRGDASFTYVDISSIDNQRKEILDPKILPVSEAPSRAKQEIQLGDVLVSMTRPNLNAVARVPMTLSGAIASTGFHVLRAVEIEPEWISLRVRSKEFVQEMSDLVQGALYPAVRPSDIQAHCLPIPPLPEQRRNVAKIEALMARSRAAREALADIPALLDRYRQSALKAALRGDLTIEWRNIYRDQIEASRQLFRDIREERKERWQRKAHLKILPPIDSTHLDSLPESWEWCRMEEVGEVRLGRQRAPKHHQGPHMRPYLRVQNVFEDRLDLSDVMTMNFEPEEAATYELVPGDVLLNEGQSLELVGRPAMYRGELPGVCFTNTLVRFRAFKGVIPEYALLVFRAYLKTGRFQEIAGWSTNIAHLGANRFAKLEFPLPPEAEQLEIVRKARALLDLADSLETAVKDVGKQSKTLDQSILAKAFRGELVPQDPSDEPAEALLARICAGREAKGAPACHRGRPAAATAPVPEPRPVPAPVALDRAAEEVIPYAADIPAREALEALDTDALMAAFRQTLATQTRWDSDEDLLRTLAQHFGYQRLGSRTKETLKGHLRAALLRRIAVREADGTLALGPRTLDAYTRDELIACIPSVLRKGQTLDREDLMRALLHHLGFQRLTDPAQDALKSAINGAIRRSLLEVIRTDQLRRIA